MCGIVGCMATDEIDLDEFHAALNFLSDRGPNASGSYVDEDVAIGHRRLSIIDLEGNRQPLESKCKNFVIAYNGEIYNYVELNKVLLENGVVLEHVNDTAVLLELYVLFGEKCLGLLNGMFAFVVWDKRKKTLFSARDRVGEKPLYYAINKGKFYFASTVSALKKFKAIKLSINSLAVNEFLMHQYISTGSIYSELKRLEPGHYITYSASTGLSSACYWQPLPPFEKLDEKDVCEKISALTNDSVKIRLRSDVPVGLFLSGGLDSSILASIATKHLKRLDSFCVGFDQKSYDESRQAARASCYYSTQHHEILVNSDSGSLVDKIKSILQVIGEPFADPAMVPMWDLCRVASRHVTVALSGDGADEIFGGYRRYYAGKYLPPFFHKEPFSFLFGTLAFLLKSDREYFSKSTKKRIFLLHEYLLNRKSFKDDLRPKVFNEQGILKLTNSFGTLGAWGEKRAMDANYSILLQHQLTDFFDYLPNDILLKTDRISMHFGLEVRTPFLDHRLIEAVLYLPDEYKISLGQQKKVLRNTFKNQILPEVYQGVKHGFAPPLHRWLEGELASVLASAIDDACLDEYVDREYIKTLWAEHLAKKCDHSHKLWNIVIFYLWLVYEAV